MRTLTMAPVALAGALAIAAAAAPAAADVTRTDLTTESTPGVTIAVREVIDPEAPRRGDPVVLIHGARVPGIPSFDIDVPGGSLAADLAEGGLPVYIVDLRGYGGSTRPAAMDEPASASAPLVRSGEAATDILAAVDLARERTGAPRVSLLGWATGGHWAGLAATLRPDAIGRVVFYNTLYGGTPDHSSLGAGSRLEDPDNPGRFNVAAFLNYRLNDAESLLPSWDESISGDPAAWRDPAVAEAYVRASLASDPKADTFDPPAFRAPSGAMADSFLLATGHSLWDARLMAADALVIRSGNDFWSRAEDVTRLAEHLDARGSGTSRTLTIEEATHYVHLDRAEKGRDAFLSAVTGFLTGASG